LLCCSEVDKDRFLDFREFADNMLIQWNYSRNGSVSSINEIVDNLNKAQLDSNTGKTRPE
jgi:aromatic ring-opening dioxygenase catalytic subunit (LigB family)